MENCPPGAPPPGVGPMAYATSNMAVGLLWVHRVRLTELQLRQDLPLPGGEGPGRDGSPGLAHQLRIVMHIVDRVQAQTEDLVGHVQVAEVRPGEVLAGVTGADRVHGTLIPGGGGTLDVEAARAGEQASVPRVAGGEDAVEH